MSKRYIDAYALENRVEDFEKLTGMKLDIVHDFISSQPTADVIEVVRCKDCRWGKEVCGNIECFVDTNAPSEYHGYEWFCPNGDTKEEK